MSAEAVEFYGKMFAQAGLPMPFSGDRKILSETPIPLQLNSFEDVLQQSIRGVATTLKTQAGELTTARMAEVQLATRVAPGNNITGTFPKKIATELMPKFQKIGRMVNLGAQLVTPDELEAQQPGSLTSRHLAVPAEWERLDTTTLVAIFSAELHTNGIGLTGLVGCAAVAFGLRDVDASTSTPGRRFSDRYAVVPLRAARRFEEVAFAAHAGIGRRVSGKHMGSSSISVVKRSMSS
jgi:hypothetical protein